MSFFACPLLFTVFLLVCPMVHSLRGSELFCDQSEDVFFEGCWEPPEGCGGYGAEGRYHAMMVSDSGGSPSKLCVGRDALSKRAQDLQARLMINDVRFEDVSGSLYVDKKIEDFRRDILRLMHMGVGVCETEDARFSYCGNVDVNYCCPEYPVSWAMFDLLCARKSSLFELKFELYSQGYRKYSPDFMDSLELGLVIGDVHPRDRVIFAKSSKDLVKTLRELWKQVRGKTFVFLNETLRKQPIQRRYISAMRRLWEVDQSGCFGALQKMKESWARKNAPACQHALDDLLCPVSVGSGDDEYLLKRRRQVVILTALQEHVGQKFTVSALLDVVGLTIRAKGGQSSFLQEVLNIALDGWPIDYNKEEGKEGIVEYLSEPKKVGVPERGTNLLTEVYRLIRRYPGGILQEELAYFTYWRGYWFDEEKQITRRVFFERLRRYKRFLAMAGWLDAGVCLPQERANVRRQSRLWLIVKHHGFLNDVADYRRFNLESVVQEDLTAVSFLQDFVDGEVYKTFLSYVSAQENQGLQTAEETFVEGLLRDNSYKQNQLVSLCLQNGINGRIALWAIAGKLTCKPHGGRLVYDPDQDTFSWRYDAGLPKVCFEDCVVEAFLLKKNYPEMCSMIVLHMLKQKGFTSKNKNDVQVIMRGLDVLGLKVFEARGKGIVNTYRAMVEKVMQQKGKVEPEKDKHGQVVWSWKVTLAVTSWVNDGTMLRLWSAYLRCKEAEPSPEPAGQVVKKRRMLEMQESPEDVIFTKIYPLYQYLCSRGVWRSAL